MEVQSRQLPGGTEESHELPYIASIRAKIRTEHLPNRSLERYRYTSLLGVWTIYEYILLRVVCVTIDGVWIGE
jgi:hypothetical protein